MMHETAAAFKARARTTGMIAAGLLALAGLAVSTRSHAAEAGGDAARGARLFLQCRACHAVAPGSPAGVGPNLWGVVGSKAGSRPGYHYSAALTASGVTWTPVALDRWLTRPTDVAAGTTMAFQGVPSAQSRSDIITYLITLAPPGAGK